MSDEVDVHSDGTGVGVGERPKERDTRGDEGLGPHAGRREGSGGKDGVVEVKRDRYREKRECKRSPK